ncbi:integrase [Rugosimonospora africana]|uniref:Uncharacterized protein n=1 Tax=Rugosimonospora africana TaxID=556532 RepID=A0A8J3QUL4_9ACTN|nr:integrase [Rugosimonospora africana]GIH16028.1 hypothetical protein Raf01_42000 [Rugosimonospora africana]
MPADPDRVAAARQLLSHLGVTLADLQAEPGPALPTLGEYLPRVVAAAGIGSRRTYGTYWNRMAGAWGAWTLDAIAASDIEAMQRQTAASARSRRNSRSGRHAGEHVIAAARAIYNRAIADGLYRRRSQPSPPSGQTPPITEHSPCPGPGRVGRDQPGRPNQR